MHASNSIQLVEPDPAIERNAHASLDRCHGGVLAFCLAMKMWAVIVCLRDGEDVDEACNLKHGVSTSKKSYGKLNFM